MVGDQVKIGYSFWGFLGPGILDTPDGGRSHRQPLVDGIAAAGHEVLFLQENRDLHEAGLDLRDRYLWCAGLPPLDALFLEWRWPIPGRNTTPRGTPGHTPDLHRQDELLAHYAVAQGVPTVVWDKDRRLARNHRLRRRVNVGICEPALRPTRGATSLLFPVADASLDSADPIALTVTRRGLPLVYVGNQYDRDEPFDTFFAPAAARFSHRVAGKWTRTATWPHVKFTGRCAFGEVAAVYRSSLATVLLLPERYARAAQMTQRLFEAVLAGCLPITPARIRRCGDFAPPELHVEDGVQVIERIEQLLAVAGTPAHADLLAGCIRRLDRFRLSRQIETLTTLLADLVSHPRRRTSGTVTPRTEMGNQR
ncbi:MAG: hypothetical protein M3R63_09030 [Actinomycetota bacterium]|nr:hypothetical protein [Actinomycetota bacterium]